MDDFLLTPDRDLCIKMRIHNPDPHYNVCGSNSPLAEHPPPIYLQCRSFEKNLLNNHRVSP